MAEMRKAPAVVIDLGLCKWVVMPGGYSCTTPKLIEQKHQELHKEQTNHVHIDGSLHKIGG